MKPVGAWEEEFSSVGYVRESKPRAVGLNVLIDKGLGPYGLADLLETAGHVIDHIKLAFGTSVAMTERAVRDKLDRIRAHGIDVYPGGTLLEVAILRGVLPGFLRRAQALGFTMIEVSDGTLPMSAEERADVIGRALDMGFGVISEVGSKDPRRRLPVETMQVQVAQDLELGSSYVIIEAREGGRGVGIYDRDGAVDEAELDALVRGLDDLDRVVWEAPQCAQQAYLINRFGPNVNLGNIPPSEVLALEALRTGLRFDTLRSSADARSKIETTRA